VIRTMLQHSIRRPLTTGLMAIAILLLAVGNALPCHAAETRQLGQSKPLSHGSPQKKAPYQPGASPYKTGANDRPKYFVPPTNPRTPTWKMYGTPPRVTPGDPRTHLLDLVAIGFRPWAVRPTGRSLAHSQAIE